MRGKKSLTETEFEAIRPYLTRMKERNITAVKDYLVNGKKQIAIAEELGVTKKAVSQMVNKAWQIHLEKGITPEGWVTFNVTLPEGMADVVKQMEKQARATQQKGDK
ncbi:hypothetical protein DUQ00_22055 [Salmonella bongori]|jgi:plasmid maintenance system antidote protein VapI|uniref:TrfB transcriptional repressor protein domain-containing protein n=2 Tax=Salmonella enterica TaxID=28901 RepID=A0A5W3IRA9_SALMU|nr:TrfB-related DNA-binding protein [Salmonella enterica]EBS5600544.1 hypothetical protein [Salmonella enterica subsp. enterica serovar Monschaui]EBW6611834.1 hypothetical protein [Salmonella enterica subsp. enterica serovar Muenchen]ECB6235006.1 hypothetical protein [Salmonella enterica subsp. enterica serovar Minnesota]ECC9598924.1 hypothetical protein [Salmonella bongori]EIM5291226.1 hypothetical protein [Salmonella enterica subsp. enterica serovar Ealing]EKV6319614.1 hypothetical protein 